MTAEQKRTVNEPIKDWIKRTSIDDSGRLLKKWKHKMKYAWYYDTKFKLTVKYLSFKRWIRTQKQ